MRSHESATRQRRAARRLAALAVGVVAAGAPVALASTPATTVFLASNKGPDLTPAQCRARGGCGPQVTAPVVLRAQQTYTIRVTGTVSAWSFWAPGPCGKPEPRPEFPTRGAVTPTSDDAQFRFAFHLSRTTGCGAPLPLPRKVPYFQMNLGNGWIHPTAANNPSRPSGNNLHAQHPYMFQVIGQGAKPKFRYNDNHPSDNDGQFKIVITAEQ